MKIPFLDLKKQYGPIRPQVDKAIKSVIDSGHFILGENVSKFEEEFAKHCKTKYAVGLASGTDALELSLRALGIGKGDYVATTPFTFIATCEAIVTVGARPIFVDIDPVTYNMDVAKLEELLKKFNKRKRIKAVMPVHLYGQPCDMKALMRVARKYKLKVIEDAAQAVGSEVKGKRVGSFGDCGCFSFFPSKNLSTAGDGGMVVTNDKKIAEELKLLRVHGSRIKYHHIAEGKNSRLDELHAAILRVKLKHIDKWTRKRIANAASYTRLFRKNKLDRHLVLPKILKGIKHCFHIYTLSSNNREDLVKYLKGNGVPVIVYYPIPIHLAKVYKKFGYKKGDFPNAEKASLSVFSIPMYPELESKHISYIVKQFKNYYNSH